MPPQAFALGGALVWNFHRSRHDKVTLSQFARKHPAAFVIGWVGLNVWLIPHILERP